MAKSKKFISLADHNPELVLEWNSIQNEGVTPQTISYGSAKKVSWKCAQGHEWDASPNDRSRGRGCPECAKIQRAITKRKTIVAKYGSLADNNPELARQWHPTRNRPLTANDISANSAERVWWLCENGHEWDAPISSRNSGVGCPVCSGHRIVVGINDLSTVRPDLAKQWHKNLNGDLKPTDVTAGNGNSVWWICEKGHEWRAKISNRANGNNCPFCIGKKVLVGYNDLDTVMPSLAKEWNFAENGDLTPKMVTIGSNKKVWWKCEKGHEWQATISHRSRGEGCPKCFGESKTSFPEQAIFFYLSQVTQAYNRYRIDARTEIDIYLPEYKIGVEYDGAYFHQGEKAEKRERKKQEKLKKLGILLIRVREFDGQTSSHVIYSKPGANDAELTKTIQGLLNSICSVAQVSFNVDIDIKRDRNRIYEQYILHEKENSLLVVNPKLASEWHKTRNGDLLPAYVSAHSNKKVWWQCTEGHEWAAVINSRASGAGCPYCAGQKCMTGYNDLATKNPEIAKQWHPTKNGNTTPQNIMPQSNQAFWWQCGLGHEWKASAVHRIRGRNCPVCSGHKVLPGFNDLATVNPKLAAEWNKKKNLSIAPTDVTVGTHKKVWWKCELGHEWKAAIYSRNNGRGCPYCANQKLLVGYNDLATVHPKLSQEWHPVLNGGVKATDVITGSNKKAWWLGQCGHEWEAAISSRIAGRGCPYCASQKLLKGFNDLATVNPKLALEWHPTKNGELTPSDVMPGTNKSVWWLCKNGHEWENVINTRSGGNGCPYCCNQMVLKGYNDLETLNPALAKEWHPTKNGELKPADFVPGSNKKAWWQCAEGHEWEAIISSRNKGHGCPQCAINRRTERRKNK